MADAGAGEASWNIAQEGSIEYGQQVHDDLPGDAVLAYRFVAEAGVSVGIHADSVPRCGAGDNDASCLGRCDGRTYPLLLLRGPYEEGRFTHRVAILGDSADYIGCDLDATIVTGLRERGVYQIIAVDGSERTGPLPLSLTCIGSECRPACAAGCPEGSECVGSGSEALCAVAPIERQDPPRGLDAP
jgi:hypothetical protein